MYTHTYMYISLSLSLYIHVCAVLPITVGARIKFNKELDLWWVRLQYFVLWAWPAALAKTIVARIEFRWDFASPLRSLAITYMIAKVAKVVQADT